MLIEVIKNTIMITSFVLVIMLLLEFLNVHSHGKWLARLSHKRWGQYFIAAFLGLIPGCVGTFGVVSMYMHNFISFGALVTALSVTFGDEAFVMFALIPSATIKIVLIILVIGVLTGIIVDFFFKNVKLHSFSASHFEIHHAEDEAHEKMLSFKNAVRNLKNISFPRATLAGGAILILLGIVSGEFVHAEDAHEHIQLSFSSHSYWGWEQISFFIIMILGLLMIIKVSDHFLEAHLWKHIIRKHFLKIFLWTFGALLLIELFHNYFHWDQWIAGNQLIILFLAVLIGIIPESGPHLIFVSLFISGSIPFTTLLASSIVQDGHGALPLFAESKKSFFLAKAVNIFIGLIVGLIGLYFL